MSLQLLLENSVCFVSSEKRRRVYLSEDTDVSVFLNCTDPENVGSTRVRNV